MATSLQNLVCDNSTLAHFISWAQAISTFIGTTAGWTQAADTGQVNWGTLSAVPGSGATVYEIWQPNDGLTNFYLKVEYGNYSGQTNSPIVRVSIGSATNGAGTLAGNVVGPFSSGANAASPSSSNLYECRFSGAPGRLHIMMWRLAGSGYGGAPQAFSVERSINASGVYTSAHVTLFYTGVASVSAYSTVSQQTLHLTNGVAPAQSLISNANSYGGLAATLFCAGNGSLSGVFNNSIGFDTMAPYIGYFDNQLTGIGLGNQASFSEGQVFSTSLYGNSVSYIVSANGPFGRVGPNAAAASLCVRFD